MGTWQGSNNRNPQEHTEKKGGRDDGSSHVGSDGADQAAQSPLFSVDGPETVGGMGRVVYGRRDRGVPQCATKPSPGRTPDAAMHWPNELGGDRASRLVPGALHSSGVYARDCTHEPHYGARHLGDVRPFTLAQLHLHRLWAL